MTDKPLGAVAPEKYHGDAVKPFYSLLLGLCDPFPYLGGFLSLYLAMDAGDTDNIGLFKLNISTMRVYAVIVKDF